MSVNKADDGSLMLYIHVKIKHAAIVAALSLVTGYGHMLV